MEKFLRQFTEEKLRQGDALEADARILYGGPDRLEAEIQDGPALVTTRLLLKDRRLTLDCDCDTAFPCHHAVTALRLAEQSGDLQLALKRSVPGKLFPANAAPETDSQELHYQPDHRHQTTTAMPPPYRGPGQQDYHLEYDTQQAPTRHAAYTQYNGTANDATQLLYILPLDQQPTQANTIKIQLYWRQTALPGQQAFPAKPLLVDASTAVDSKALAFLLNHSSNKDPDGTAHPVNTRFLPRLLVWDFLSLLTPRDLLRWTQSDASPRKIYPLAVDTTSPLSLHLAFTTVPQGILVAPASAPAMDLSGASFLPPSLLIANGKLYRADYHGEESALCTYATPATLPPEHARRLIRQLATRNTMPLPALPTDLQPTLLAIPPKGKLYIRTAVYKHQGHEQLHAILSFQYGAACIDEFSPESRLGIAASHAIIPRDPQAEEALKHRLEQLGFRFNSKSSTEELGWKLHPAKLDTAVRELVLEDWLITAEGKTYRKPKVKQATVSSGLDWFDLEATVDFDGMDVSLPELLQAQAGGAKAVRLDDGTYGILPLEWLENFTPLTELGEQAGDAIRFKLQQAALVESLLAKQQTDFDERFREEARTFREIPIVPADPPQGFQATLRPYQREGLGWLLAMNQLHLGACLADDMGLGKTIQVIAFIATRIQQGNNKPTLVVVPKSLLFNWQQEAQKFAPALRVLIHLGAGRDCRPQALAPFHIILTTYGTLRNDAIKLARIQFDACILDESQTIKNAHAAAAEAAKLIQADFRLAMTGTPIENSLSELASQLDFLNPGLFGTLLKTPLLPGGKLPDSTLTAIQKAVRPFILRRTKQQVAKDLPPKSELVLWCELDDAQRDEYTQLKNYYRKKLLGQKDDKNAGQSTMETLLALLRLRQEACHPALLNENRQDDPSAKLDLLMDKLTDLTQEHHKALVFSQFTTFLKLIAKRLDTAGIHYNYLDGQTADRQAQVEDFQQSPKNAVFLISLKAGGVGLNLTAADYIFLMDPWWNPATEAQAIDRAYRIGQTKPVFAYRVIAKDTIEEKVLTMQQNKKMLADAILNRGNTGQPTKLTQEDIDYLLS